MRYLLLATIVSLSSCVVGIRERGNGDMITETFELDNFDEIIIGGAYEVQLVSSNREGVEVEIDENLVEFLRVEKRGSTLEISNRERIYSNEGIEITVYYKDLEAISITGACELETEGTLVSGELKIEMSGAGSIKLDLDVDDLALDISGAGAVSLDGKATQQKIRMSGAGGYSGRDLISERVDIEISGVGSADIYVTEELTATIGGMGGITYRGDPTKVISNVSGLGTVRNAEK